MSDVSEARKSLWAAIDEFLETGSDRKVYLRMKDFETAIRKEERKRK